MVMKRYTKNNTINTIPCSMVVLPVLSERTIINKLNKNKIVDSELIPSVSGRPIKIDRMETVGMVKPILANADPRERLKLF